MFYLFLERILFFELNLFFFFDVALPHMVLKIDIHKYSGNDRIVLPLIKSKLLLIITKPYFRKKKAASPKRKKDTFLYFQGKKRHIFFTFKGHVFHATLMLMHEMPEIGPDYDYTDA